MAVKYVEKCANVLSGKGPIGISWYVKAELYKVQKVQIKISSPQ